jgi:murein DD-endopeptidase
MTRKLILEVVATATLLLVVSLAFGQTPGSFPAIDVQVPMPPTPFTVGGQTHLVYELHVTNLYSRQIVLEAIEVRNGQAIAADPLLRLEGQTLSGAVRRLGAPPDDPNRRAIGGGQSLLVFVWVTLKPSSVPASLRHRFTGQVDGETVMINGVDVAVSRHAPPVIGPPLGGDHWLAANGPDNGADHRRTLLALSGQGRIAQRFAIDWVRPYDDGRTLRGDSSSNASYRAYGADVLAVADAIVSETQDEIPENIPDPIARAVPITPETLVGNYVMLEIGESAYAIYAHLQPGSLTVKKGDRVHRGQVLARVGNSGNSTEPHLHFHVADRNSPLDSEGVPYALDSFGLEAPSAQVTPAIVPVGNSLGLYPTRFAKWIVAPPERRQSELPLINRDREVLRSLRQEGIQAQP